MAQTCGWCGGPSEAGTCDGCLAQAEEGLPPEPQLEPVAAALGSGPDAAVPAAAAPGWYPVDGTTRWWDGSQWADRPTPRPTGPFRPVRSLGVAAQALVAVACVVSVLAIVAGIQQRSVLARAARSDVTLTVDEVRAADDLADRAAELQIVALLVAGVVFLVWLHRVFRNLDGPLAVRGLEHTPGWAVGWWFVPVMNLLKPKQIVDEAVRASRLGTASGARADEAPLVVLWWAAVIVSGVLIRVGNAIGGTTANLTAARTGLAVHMASDASLALAGVLLVLIIRTVVARQEEAALDRVAAAG